MNNQDDISLLNRVCGSRAGAIALVVVGSVFTFLTLLFLVIYIHIRVLKACCDWRRYKKNNKTADHKSNRKLRKEQKRREKQARRAAKQV